MSHRKTLTQNRSSGKPHRRPITVGVLQGQVGFRLLCSIYSAGGVIGHSGAIVKRLERETTARIHVEEAISTASKERIVNIVGSATVDRRIQFDGEDESLEVSVAQEGLIRVFERVLELEPPSEGAVVRCRLLVARGRAGAVIGEGGKRISKIIKESGAFVKILHSESLPPCADSADELVQITGVSLAVKKALVAVSQYLQEKASQLVRANGASSSLVLHSSVDMEMNDLKISDEVTRELTAEVVFRLLCPCDAAGAVIGWKGKKVKALEDETGASICFSAPEAGYNERVITVSAIENRESTNSAQYALLCVFNEITSDRRRAVTARLLIEPNQAEWLNVGVTSNISAIQKATGSELLILKDSSALFGAPADQRIIQIDGEHSSVLIALSQVSWRLRENMIGKDDPPLLPHKPFNVRRCVDEAAALTDKLNKFHFQLSQFSNGCQLPTSRGSPRNLATSNGGFELGSGNKSIMVTNTKVEIVVRKDLFGSVYGDDGSNLARLRTISGADVEVQDPSPESDGKVIISGTPDQTLAAQSLLQAFMMAGR